MKVVFIIFFLIISNYSYANNSFYQSKVNKVILHDFGVVLIELEGVVQTEEACSNKSALVLQRTNQHFSEMFASLLAAYHADTKISGWVNGCDEKHNKPILTRLDLMPK